MCFSSLEEKKSEKASLIFNLGLQRCLTPNKLSTPTDQKVQHLLRKDIRTNSTLTKEGHTNKLFFTNGLTTKHYLSTVQYPNVICIFMVQEHLKNPLRH